MMEKPMLWVPIHSASILRSSPIITGLLSLGFPSTDSVNKIQLSWNSCEDYYYIKCPSENRRSVNGDHYVDSVLNAVLLAADQRVRRERWQKVQPALGLILHVQQQHVYVPSIHLAAVMQCGRIRG